MFEVSEFRGDAVRVQPVFALHVGMDQVHAHVRQQQAVGRGDARVGRDDDPRHSQPIGQIAGVQRARATERDQGVAARVAPAFDRYRANAGRDVLDRDAQNPLGRGGHVQVEPVGQLLHRGAGARGVERNGAPGQGGHDSSEHEVGVRHRRPVAAPVVTRRPGMRPGAVRPDLQAAPARQPGDRSAARAHGVQVDHRRLDVVDIDLALGQHARLAVFDQADVGRRAAHVERDDVAVPGQRAEVHRGDHPGRGAGQGRGNRQARNLLRPGQPAARPHDVERRADVLFVQMPCDAVVIGRQQRHERGVETGGVGAFVFTVLAKNVGRNGDEALRIDLAQHVAHFLFVGRVAVGVQQRHRDRANAARLEILGRGAHFVGVHRPDALPAHVHPFVDLADAFERHHARRFDPPRDVAELAGHRLARAL